MKYCYNCNRITPGKPLFCGSCGRSFDIKLCPRLHANSRRAEVCSQCGSRDLSSPQPRIPFFGRLVVFLLTVILWVLVIALTLTFVLIFLRQILTNTNVIQDLMGIAIIVGLMWWMWTQIPLWLREALYRWLRGRNRDRRHE